MKKKLISIALAAALCLGMAVPSMAADVPSVEEGLKPVSITYDIGAGEMPAETTLVEKQTKIGMYDPDTDGEKIGTLKDYAAIKANTVFTVKHTGTKNDGSYIRIYMKELVLNEDGVYALGGGYPHMSYLTASGAFVKEWSDPTDEGGVVELYPGESRQFTLPMSDEGDDVIYRVEYIISYPEYDYHYTRYQFYKVDDATVDACLAKLDKQETPAEEPAPPAEETKPAEQEEPKQEAPAKPVSTSFKDVSEDKYYATPVAWAVEKSITSGTTADTFFPEQTCTNAQILTFLWRAMGQPEATIANPFADVDASKYYYKAALWAYENGLVEGDTFNPSIPCTRAMTVTYQWKAAGKHDAAQEAAFGDVRPDSAYAKAVAWAVEKGITAGTSDITFSPDQICTRGQIVTFLYKDLGK